MQPKPIICLILLSVLLMAACGEKRPAPVVQHLHKEIKAKPKTMPDTHELMESFTDSLNIGRKGFNKVSLEQFKIEDSTYVVIRFFSKHADKWIIKNEFHLPKDGITSSDPSVSDFNNDVLNDFTFISAIAARGGNEIRTLFIYNKKNDDLILVKNSDTFPNLSYNEELNCIEAFALSGCNSTIFAILEADSLRTFARADQCDSIKVFAYDKKGEEKLILKRSINGDDAMDFTDYNLLKKYRRQ